MKMKKSEKIILRLTFRENRTYLNEGKSIDEGRYVVVSVSACERLCTSVNVCVLCMYG